MKRTTSFVSDSGAASIEFIFLGLLVPLLTLSFGMNALGSQRQKIICQIFAWQSVRQVAEHIDESQDEILVRLNSLAVAKESSLKLDPGVLRVSIDGDFAEGGIVTVRVRLRDASAVSSMRMP